MNQDNLDNKEILDFELLLPKAESGDARAQFLLGYLFLEKRQDKVSAFEWMMKAAENGDADAQESIATFYERGVVVEKNNDIAKKWLKKASDQGSSEAMVRLSRYLCGSDKDEAVSLAMRAADGGNVKAIRLMGEYYHHGAIGYVDIDKAIEWYKRAADLGDSVSASLYRQMASVKRIDMTDAFPELPVDAEPTLVGEDFEKVKHALYLAHKSGDTDAESLLEWVEKHDNSRARYAYANRADFDNKIADFPLFEGKPISPCRELGKSLLMSVAGVYYNAYQCCRSIVEGHTCYEPNNESDPNAVALIADNGRKIGYIPKHKQEVYESTFFGDNVRFVAFLMGKRDRLILFTADNRASIWNEYKKLLMEYLNLKHHFQNSSYSDWKQFERNHSN